MPNILVIQHVLHERLGTFEAVFKEAGFSIATLDASNPRAKWPAVSEFDALVVMGGPMGAYEQDRYPFLKKETALIRQALKKERPILGVCLGAQLLASVLGAGVAKNHTKEIGWYPLMREPGADNDPLCEAFDQTETVFQWHGDTFSLPKGVVRLFSSPLCQEQAFRYRGNVYGLQFHVEVTEAMIRAWLIHAQNKKELAALKGQIDPAVIRAQSPRHIGRLEELARHVAGTFCGFCPSSVKTRSLTHAHR